jgi:hypothetical protein
MVSLPLGFAAYYDMPSWLRPEECSHPLRLRAFVNAPLPDGSRCFFCYGCRTWIFGDGPESERGT